MSVLPLPVVEQENQHRDGEEVQKMHSDGETHQEGNQYDPAVCIRLVSLLVPLGHRPYDEGREQ